MNTSPIVCDIETAPLLNARDFLDPPDVSDIKAPANYKKDEAIAEYIEKATADRLADFARNCDSKAALDWNVGRIVALGWWTDETGLVSGVCHNDEAERWWLTAFWREAKHRTIVGYNIKNFDLKFMMRRSLFLGIAYPVIDTSKYSRRGVIDLYLDLTFNEGTFDKGVMRRSLHAFCRRFGIPVEDTITGAAIPKLVEAGDWEAVEAHVRSDVMLEVALARRLGAVITHEMAVL